jgi:hypothetical protein
VTVTAKSENPVTFTSPHLTMPPRLSLASLFQFHRYSTMASKTPVEAAEAAANGFLAFVNDSPTRMLPETRVEPSLTGF